MGVGLATLLGFGGRLWWILDLFSHFRRHYAWLLLACVVGWAALGNFVGLGTTVVLMAVNGFAIQRVKLAPISPKWQHSFRLFHANILYKNKNYAAVLEQIARESPDIISMVELRPEWLDALQPLSKDYPYFARNDDADFYGTAIWSRHPIRNSESLWLGSDERASVVATIDNDGILFTVLATHPWPPSKPHWARSRDSQLAAVAEYIHTVEGPKMVVGDLNATPWSHALRSLVADSGLRLAHPPLASWPLKPRLLRIPIDHCLVSKEFTLCSAKVGAPTGSDHLPLIVDLALLVA